MRRLLITAAGLLAIINIGIALVMMMAPKAALANPTGAQPPCPPGMTCITGKLLVRDPGSDTPHQFLVLEKNGAPMLWVDYGGTGSGGAPVCVFSLQLEPLACLGGPWGNYGGEPVVTLYAHGRGYSLTAGDITWIHAHEWRPR